MSYECLATRTNLAVSVFRHSDTVIPFEYGYLPAMLMPAGAGRFVTNASAAGIDIASVTREPGS
jgi:hypothetical protein